MSIKTAKVRMSYNTNRAMRLLHLSLCLLLPAAILAQDAKPLPEQKLKRETLAEAIAYERFKDQAGARQAQIDAAERAGQRRTPAVKKTPPPPPPAKK